MDMAVTQSRSYCVFPSLKPMYMNYWKIDSFQMLDRMNLIQSLFKQCFFLSHFRQIKDIIVWVTWEYPWREARQGFTTRAQFLGNQALAHLKNSANQPRFLRMLRLDAWLERSPDSIGLPGLRGAPSCTEQLCPVLWTRESTPVSHRLGGRWLQGISLQEFPGSLHFPWPD